MVTRPIPPPPRRVRLRSIWKAPDSFAPGYVGMVFLLVGFIQAAVFSQLIQPWVDLALDRSAEVVQGELISTEVVRSEHYGSRHPTRFIYRFVLGDDGGSRTIEGRSKSLEPHTVVVDNGNQVRVELVPEHPQWNRVEGTRYSVTPLWVLGFPLGLLVAGLVLVLAGVRSRAGVRRILEHGDEVAGAVVKVRVQPSHRGRPCWARRHFRRGRR
jgi:hypothetical protein